MTQIKLAQLNINSLISIYKRYALNDLIKSENLDIVLLCETKLNRKYCPKFDGFILHRMDRNNGRGGGTAILYNDSFKVDVLYPNIDLEISCISLHFTASKILLVSIYIPPDKLNISNLNQLFIFLKNCNQPFIVGGDFNCHHPKWGSNHTSRNGKLLFDWFTMNQDVYNFNIASSKLPTRIAGNSSAWLDFYLVSNDIFAVVPGFSSLDSVDFSSDHRAVLFSFLTNDNLLQVASNKVFNYRFANWNRLNRYIENSTSNMDLNISVNNKEALENIAISFTNTIQQGMELFIPKVKINNTQLIKLPFSLIKLISIRRKARRYRTRGHTVFQGLPINNFLQLSNKLINEGITEAHKKHYESKFSNIRVNSNVFAELRKLKGHNTAPHIMLDKHGQTITNPLSVANSFANHFASISDEQIDRNTFSLHVNSLVENTFSSPSDSTSSLKTDVIHLTDTISSLKGKKSAGPDGIPNVVIKHFSPNIILFLVTYFNLLLSAGYFPSCWSIAKVFPLLKKDLNPSNFSAYRPISLLSNLGKLFEKILFHFLMQKVSSLSIIPSTQFGFRQGISSTFPLIATASHVVDNLNKKLPTIGISLDVKSAFDLVWHNGLIYKLYFKYNLDFHLCKILHSYLANRKLFVNIGNINSDEVTLKRGTPQGAVLSPLLFNLFIADFPLFRGTSTIKNLHYADDTFILASYSCVKTLSKDINEYLQKIFLFYSRWALSLNAAKSNFIVFFGCGKAVPYNIKRKFLKVIPKINAVPITRVNAIKYLGIIFSEKFNFVAHIDYLLNKGNKAFFSAMSLVRNRAVINPVKLHVYKTVVRPVVGYAFAVWCMISSHQMERIRLYERRWLRSFLGICRGESGHFVSTARLYKLAGIKRIDKYLIDLAIRFFDRFSVSGNDLIPDCLRENLDSDVFCRPANLIGLIRRGKVYDHLGNAVFYHRPAYDETLNSVYNRAQ